MRLSVNRRRRAGRIERADAVLGSSAGPRVLVLDDIEDLRILIRRALTARGYQVDVAATLAEARGMDPGRYDAVLVDAHLGHERGMDLVEALLSADPSAASRCLVMSGGVPEPLPDGVASLAKPFQIGELVDAVRALHEPDSAQPPDGHVSIAPGSGAHPAAVVVTGGNQPAAAEPQAWQLLRLTRRLRAREHHELIDFLHDGPIQELTAVTLELQMISRSAPAAPCFDAVIKHLNAATGALRWLVDGPWQSVQPETKLDPALHERSAWLLAAPLTVDGDEQSADLAVAEIPVIADVVELMLLGMVTASPPAQAHVAVRADQHLIEIELTLTSAAGDDQAIGDPATAQAALDTLASALGARAHARLGGPCWQAQLALPRQPAAMPEQSSLPTS
jgi:DNA-binding response OmpR family regulator